MWEVVYDQGMSELLRYLLLLSYVGIFVLKFGVNIVFATFAFGGLIGFHFFEIERLFLSVVGQPSSVSVAHRFQQAFQPSSERLISRELFFPLYLLVTVFIVTSTGSIIGTGVMLGLGVRYVWEILRDAVSLGEFYDRYLRRWIAKPSTKNLRKIAFTYLGVFAILSILVLL